MDCSAPRLSGSSGLVQQRSGVRTGLSEDHTCTLQIDVTRRDGYTVLSPHGEIDFATGPQLKDAITELLVAGDVNLVVDLLEVDFIESTGLGALIGGRRRAHALQRLAGPGVHRGPDAEDLPDHRPRQGLPIHDTVEAAVGTAPSTG